MRACVCVCLRDYIQHVHIILRGLPASSYPDKHTYVHGILHMKLPCDDDNDNMVFDKKKRSLFLGTNKPGKMKHKQKKISLLYSINV